MTEVVIRPVSMFGLVIRGFDQSVSESVGFTRDERLSQTFQHLLNVGQKSEEL
jgi:hypothetical protein